MKSLIDFFIDYEQGLLSERETLEFFSELISTNMAWRLQGHYGRTAINLIESGCLDKKGKILVDIE